MGERHEPTMERFDRYLTDLAQGRAGIDDGLDPALAATARRIKALDTAPPPDAAFLRRLGAELMPPPGEIAPDRQPPLGRTATNGRVPSRSLPVTVRWPTRYQGWSSAMATAALVLLTIVGSVFVFGRRSSGPGGGPGGVSSRTLLRTTVEEPPPGETSLFLNRFTAPPGERSLILRKGMLLAYVETGSYSVRAEGSVRIVRAAPPGHAAPAETPAAGTSSSLDPGDLFLVPQQTAFTLGNTGSTSANFLGVFFLPHDPFQFVTLSESDPAGKLWAYSDEEEQYLVGIGDAPFPDGPITVTLLRTTLQPGGRLPRQVLAGPLLLAVEAGTVRIVKGDAGEGERTAGGNADAFVDAGIPFTLRNPGDAPASVLLLTVEPAATGGEPLP